MDIVYLKRGKDRRKPVNNWGGGGGGKTFGAVGQRFWKLGRG